MVIYASSKSVVFGEAEACLFCEKLAKAIVSGKMSDFCSKACGTAPIILDVPSTEKTYQSDMENLQFQKGQRRILPLQVEGSTI
ncbi:hypothetical protein PHLCEN_2v6873 [Hermanssonia centrifuga]|uniref:Uncharacterized protein n=1 Tax=Hermanssonia centrifuga TaxID=98765 RepID=A0A2R6NY41_9APHY|nr:hypothetical protein PHLCEN_2v6873 [Hermanssonia centrifuga]